MQKVFKFEKNNTIGLIRSIFLARIIYPSDKSLARIVVFCNRLIVYFIPDTKHLYTKSKTQINVKIPKKTPFLLTVDRILSTKKAFPSKRKSPKKPKYLYLLLEDDLMTNHR